ncbi:MAG: peptidase S10, partial [Rhodospirillales bacterium]|nr:peptidase S10 [Rhodospirillales bacterium]
APSAPADPIPNAETWLDLTDLVFLDPPGTGYARILGGEDARRAAWSVDGDIALLAQAIRRWLDRNDRMLSPKYLLGESYGGFRAPRLTRRLQEREGVGISGMVLLSPALDLGRIASDNDPMAWVYRLPSEVAALRALHGPVTRESLGDVESYAAGEYVTDLLRGVRDEAAVARLNSNVTRLTGLDPELVRRAQGRLDTDVFLHEIARARAEVGSAYDATVLAPDPTPHRPFSRYADPMLDGLRAPITAAMVTLYRRFGWQPDGVYRLVGDAAFRGWNWGRGMSPPESVGALQAALALDPRLRVLVAHGMYDLVTPYFATDLLLRQVPAFAGPERLRLVVYPGGHMFYSDDEARAALHRDAAAIYAQR